MSADGLLGNKLKIGYRTSSPGSWTKVAAIRSVEKFFELVSPKVDTFVSGDTIKTTIPGIPEAPEIEFTIRLDPDPATTPSHETLRTLQAAGTIIWWRTERPTNTAGTVFRPEEFRGYVLSFQPMAPLDGIQEAKVVISYSGDYCIYEPEASEIT